MKKQTAGNNNFLKNVKSQCNTKIFKKASLLLNSKGESAAREYVQSFQLSTLSF